MVVDRSVLDALDVEEQLAPTGREGHGEVIIVGGSSGLGSVENTLRGSRSPRSWPEAGTLLECVNRAGLALQPAQDQVAAVGSGGYQQTVTGDGRGSEEEFLQVGEPVTIRVIGAEIQAVGDLDLPIIVTRGGYDQLKIVASDLNCFGDNADRARSADRGRAIDGHHTGSIEGDVSPAVHLGHWSNASTHQIHAATSRGWLIVACHDHFIGLVL